MMTQVIEKDVYTIWHYYGEKNWWIPEIGQDEPWEPLESFDNEDEARQYMIDHYSGADCDDYTIEHSTEEEEITQYDSRFDWYEWEYNDSWYNR